VLRSGNIARHGLRCWSRHTCMRSLPLGVKTPPSRGESAAQRDYTSFWKQKFDSERKTIDATYTEKR